MTNEEAIKTIMTHVEHWHRLLRDKICDETEGKETIEAFLMAIEALNQNQWIPCSEPPEDDRSVFIAYGNEGLKSCCIGFYEPDDKCWREQKNFFASLIYDAKYWCDMPELPEGWYE